MTVKRALVVTVSTRAAAGEWDDRSGPVLRDGLLALGLEVDGPVVVSDGAPVEGALRGGVAAAYDVVVTTGGTGLPPTGGVRDALEVLATVLPHALDQIPGSDHGTRSD